MNDRFAKYSKLYFLIVGVFLLVQIALALLVGFFYGFFKIFAGRFLDITYELLVMALTPALFTSVYYIFIRRTKKHPNKAIKIISQVLMVLAFCSCLIVPVVDMLQYFKLKPGTAEIGKFWCFSIYFLAGNITLMFIVAIMQAFTTAKEVDWVERRRQREEGMG
jgi:hypothetical protein